MSLPALRASLFQPAAWVASRLRGRADAEHEMSFNRLAFAVLIVIYLVVTGDGWPDGALRAMALYVCLAFGVLGHIVLRPQVCNPRRSFALAIDMGALAWQLHIGDASTALIYPIYLWVIFGNGFRFGLNWLRVAAAAGVVSFGAVVATTPFWRGLPDLSAGLLIGLVILPLYAGTLIRKLSQAKQAAERANRAKTMFLASISHELRTPLNAIIGTSVLLQNARLDASQQDMARTIDTAARSLLSMIDGILDFSRIEAGGVRSQSVEFDLLALLAEVRQIVALQAEQKGLQLGFHVTLRTPRHLHGERRQIQDVLVNLVSNALKFTHAGGIAIAVDGMEEAEERVRLRLQVSDTGIGIAAAAQGRIFDSFSQADETIINRYGGTGLGLAICKRLVEGLGGGIGVESTVGAGSTFWFEIPVRRLLPADEQGALPAEILLLSRDRPLAERLAAVLDPATSLLHVASTVQQGVDLLGARDGGTEVTVITDCRDIAEDPASIVASLRSVVPRRPLSLVLVDAQQPAGIPAPALARSYATVLSPTAPVEALRAALRIASLRQIPQQGAASEIRDARRRLRILVADDNEVNRKVLLKILQKAGHTVAAVTNGEEALDALEAGEYDTVLMDLNMPVMDGVEATKMYRMISMGQRHTTIIGLTADATPEAAERCLEAGMDSCLTKPIEPARLLDTIEAAAGEGEPMPAPALEPAEPEQAIADITAHPRFRLVSTATLDERALASLFKLGGASFVKELVGAFLPRADALLLELREAVAAEDIVQFRAHAHALASAGANLGTVRLVELCRAAQSAKRSELPTLGRTHLERLADEIHKVHAAFESVISAAESDRGGAAWA